jgi:hypothetical protein
MAAPGGWMNENGVEDRFPSPHGLGQAADGKRAWFDRDETARRWEGKGMRRGNVIFPCTRRVARNYFSRGESADEMSGRMRRAVRPSMTHRFPI